MDIYVANHKDANAKTKFDDVVCCSQHLHTEYQKHIGTEYHTLSFQGYDWSLNYSL